MGRLIVVAMALALVLPALGVSSAEATKQKCEEGFKGPNSNNLCESVATYKCSVDNDNLVTISDSTNQKVVSGTVQPSGGSSTSGNVSNDNNSSFNVVITNKAPDTKTCVAKLISKPVEVPEKPEKPGTPTTPTTPETPETPVTPVAPTNQGEGRGETSSSVKSLPHTGSDRTLQNLAYGGAGMFIVAALSAVGVRFYISRRV